MTPPVTLSQAKSPDPNDSESSDSLTSLPTQSPLSKVTSSEESSQPTACSSSELPISSSSQFSDIFGTDVSAAPTPSSLTTYKIVGDNIDKNIKPRDMRSDHQTKSLHYFHLYAVRDRIDLSKYEDNPSLPDIAPINTDQLLPSEEEAQNLRSHFAMNIARVLKKHMKFFKQFGSGLE